MFLIKKRTNIRFTSKPSEKKERLDEKTQFPNKDINDTYLDIANEIDNLSKKYPVDEDIPEEPKVDSMNIEQNKKKDLSADEKKRKKSEQSEKEIINIVDESEINKVIDDVPKKNIIYEKTGFGWKGLGTRRISYDERIKEYVYEVNEPTLTKEEEEIKKKLTYFFRTRADTDVFNMNQKEKEKYLGDSLEKIVRETHLKIDDKSKDKVFYFLFQDFIGYGKIDIIMHDEGIEDISCDGLGVPIFLFHRNFESIRTNIVFNDLDELDSFVIKLSQLCGKQISVYEPIVDGKLADGSRLQTTLSNTVTKYSTFSIRKFREDPMTPVDLIANNTMSIDMAVYFWLAIEKGTSILFCGGTASGKTTALNALSLFLPSTYKIVSIEDTREINLPHENWIAGTTRTGFASTEDFKTGKDIDMFDLIRVALRQRPRVIIVGEVRGKEAYTLFQAMTTGHLSYSTVHATDMHALIQRLESTPINLPRALLTSLDLIVFLNSVIVKGAPVRRITNVTEVIKLDPETNRLVTLTPYSWVSELDDRFESAGGSRIMHNLKLQYGWTDEQMKKEVENRWSVLQWMVKSNQRSYEQVGKIVSDYNKDPESVLKKIKEDT